MSRIDPGWGVLLLDSRISSATLTAKGAGAADSAYTESGAGPGVPVPADTVSRWRPQIRQAQTVAVQVGTIRGGYPGRAGASVVARLAADTNLIDYRGWQEPVLVTDWSAPPSGWGAASAWTCFAAAVIAETQTIIIVACDASNNAQTWSYDPVSRVWTDLYDWDTGTLDGLLGPIGMTYDASRSRLLLWSGVERVSSTAQLNQIAYFSDDFGASWQRYSQDYLDFFQAGTFDTTGIIFVVPGAAGEDWLLVVNEIANQSGGGQYASSDSGVTWQLIASTPGVGQAFKGPAGFGLVYVEFGTNDLKCALAASPRAPLALAATIETGATRAHFGCWVTVDADGTVYAYSRGTAGAGKIDEMICYRSQDGGLTWAAYDWGVWAQTNTTHYPEPYIAVAAAGAVYLIGSCVGTAANDNTVQLVRLGGWSQVAHGRGEQQVVVGTAYDVTRSRFGYGNVPNAATQGWTACYFPAALPNNLGWTAGAGTGTASISAAEPALELSTTAGQAIDFFRTGIITSSPYGSWEFELKCKASGNTTLATLGAAGGGAYVTVFLSSGAYYYEVRIDIGSDGIQMRETKTPAILATQAIAMAAQYVNVRVEMSLGLATAWYSLDGGVVWVRWANGVAVPNNAPFAAGNDGMFFGISGTRVGDVYFRLVAGAGSGDWQYGIDTLADLGSTPALGPRGHQSGRPVPGTGWAYPIPFATTAGQRMPLLTAVGGPTREGELVALPVGYTYPVTALSPIDSPRPSLGWKSADSTAVRFVYDQGVEGGSWWGGGVGLVVVRAWPRQWVLERSNDGAAWTTLGTLDLAIGTALSWTRVGRVVVPSGVPTIARYIQRDELVGGYLRDGAFCREITSNSAGYWTSAGGTTQAIRLTLSGTIVADPASGTAGELVAPTGVLTCYPAVDVATRYLRITIAAAQVTPDGTYRAGVAGIGEIMGVGADPSWGWSITHATSRRYTRGSDGSVAARRTGPGHRLGRYSWPDGLVLSKMRLLSAAPDQISISGGAPIGTGEDAWSSVPAALISRLESGTLPVVMLPRLPTTDGVTLTQPELLLYGLASTDSVTITGQVGTEGLSEILQLGEFAVEELVP